MLLQNKTIITINLAGNAIGRLGVEAALPWIGDFVCFASRFAVTETSSIYMS